MHAQYGAVGVPMEFVDKEQSTYSVKVLNAMMQEVEQLLLDLTMMNTRAAKFFDLENEAPDLAQRRLQALVAAPAFHEIIFRARAAGIGMGFFLHTCREQFFGAAADPTVTQPVQLHHAGDDVHVLSADKAFTAKVVGLLGAFGAEELAHLHATGRVPCFELYAVRRGNELAFTVSANHPSSAISQRDGTVKRLAVHASTVLAQLLLKSIGGGGGAAPLPKYVSDLSVTVVPSTPAAGVSLHCVCVLAARASFFLPRA